MIILTSVVNYNIEKVRLFLNTLCRSGFTGKTVAFANDCQATEWLKSQGVIILKIPRVPYPVNSSRYLAYSEFLEGVDEPVIITDIRDVIFQKNPTEHMPTNGINVFEEAEGVTIGRCTANTAWMNHVTPRWRDKQVICSGITSGTGLYDYCALMWDRLKHLPKIAGIDQAVHMDIIYSKQVKANIHQNEESEVYTLAYVPYETVRMDEGRVLNKIGDIPCMIHQYDRHKNLMEVINEQAYIPAQYDSLASY